MKSVDMKTSEINSFLSFRHSKSKFFGSIVMYFSSKPCSGNYRLNSVLLFHSIGQQNIPAFIAVKLLILI